MSTFVLLTVTGLGLGAMYFLIASGLSLIYGLMGVLNFAHGAFLTVGAYGSWWVQGQLDGIGSVVLRFVLAAAFGLLVGGAVAVAVELVLIRPLYKRHIEQVLVTVGLALALTALVGGIWTQTQQLYLTPKTVGHHVSAIYAKLGVDTRTEAALAASQLGVIEP